jgi:hypothetical protein
VDSQRTERHQATDVPVEWAAPRSRRWESAAAYAIAAIVGFVFAAWLVL